MYGFTTSCINTLQTVYKLGIAPLQWKVFSVHSLVMMEAVYSAHREFVCSEYHESRMN
jgi:hypothetical protein